MSTAIALWSNETSFLFQPTLYQSLSIKFYHFFVFCFQSVVQRFRHWFCGAEHLRRFRVGVGVPLTQRVNQIAVVAVIPVETVCFLVSNAIFCASFDGIFLPVWKQSLVVVHSGRSIANDAEFRIPRSDYLHDVAGLETDFFGLAAREMPFAHFVQQALVVGVTGCGVGAYRLYVAPTGRI